MTIAVLVGDTCGCQCVQLFCTCRVSGVCHLFGYIRLYVWSAMISVSASKLTSAQFAGAKQSLAPSTGLACATAEMRWSSRRSSFISVAWTASYLPLRALVFLSRQMQAPSS